MTASTSFAPLFNVRSTSTGEWNTLEPRMLETKYLFLLFQMPFVRVTCIYVAVDGVELELETYVQE